MIGWTKRFQGVFRIVQVLNSALLVSVLLISACSGLTTSLPTEINPGSRSETTSAQMTPSLVSVVADVLSVQVSGNPGEYTFGVEVASPDEDCFQYADWWEIIDEEGKLLYRRVLEHSHVDEQPFTRSGGPISLGLNQVVWIRAHMNIGGYGGAALKGSVQAGFQPADLSADFAADLANHAPLPQDCAF